MSRYFSFYHPLGQVILKFSDRLTSRESHLRKRQSLANSENYSPIWSQSRSPLSSSDNVIKSGHLMLLRDSQADQWEKIFFVRPYLHVHESAREREVQVINLTGSHVATSPEVEMLLKVSHRWAQVEIAFC